jgi:hypothetical protein
MVYVIDPDGTVPEVQNLHQRYIGMDHLSYAKQDLNRLLAEPELISLNNIHVIYNVRTEKDASGEKN